MRISERHRYDVSNTNIQRAKSENASDLERLSTQKRINAISDDPIGSTNSLTFRDRIGTLKQFQKNIDFSKGYLDRAEMAISTIQDNLIRAKELAIAMSNDTYAWNSREATAREIKEIISEVVQLANTTYNNRYVFSGFRTQTPALSTEGNFLGDDGAIFLQVSEGNFRQVNIQARDLFEASPEERENRHFNMVDSLDILYTGLMEDEKQMVYKALDELEFQMEKTSSYQASVGAMFNALQGTSKRLELDEESSTIGLSKIEDVDAYKATSDFKRSETTLQSTLLASSKLLQPSLLNFMQ